jgi:hypothetical protein
MTTSRDAIHTPKNIGKKENFPTFQFTDFITPSITSSAPLVFQLVEHVWLSISRFYLALSLFGPSSFHDEFAEVPFTCVFLRQVRIRFRMDICPLCFEGMDMLGYQDERQNTTECYKLDCGHAYHTGCIISCLTQMNRKCPQCNADKDPSKELTREALASKLIREVKRDERVKFLLGEFKEIREEYSEDIKEYGEKRAAELCVPEKSKYLMDSHKEIQSTARRIAREKGIEYVGALKDVVNRRNRWWEGSAFDRAFFSKKEAYSIRRLKFPRLYLDLFQWNHGGLM